MRLDETKISTEQKYEISDIYTAIERKFEKYQFVKAIDADGTISYKGIGKANEYGAFGKIITSLKNEEWFMPYVIKWLWFNSDDGMDEEDFIVEDILYHYTKRESVA